MQEKIEDIIVTEVEGAILAGYDWKEAWPIAARFAAAEITKLFERKVIWEREGKIAHASPFKPKVGCAGDTITLHWLGFEGQYIITPHWFGLKGQWIRIVVEDINDQQGPPEGHPAGD